MLINTYLDTEDFVHLYYEGEAPPSPQGCGAGARMASKYTLRVPCADYSQGTIDMPINTSDRDRNRVSREAIANRFRAADLYPRVRTEYDEPGLEAGFSPICGEFVHYVGRYMDGGTVAMSNYRLHIQPRQRSERSMSIPLRLIDGIEIRELKHLLLLCKTGRSVRCSFSSAEKCLEWWHRINAALTPVQSLQNTFAAMYAAYAKEQRHESIHWLLIKSSQNATSDWFFAEADRLGLTRNPAWRVSEINLEFKLCLSYPQLLVVPASINDADLDTVAKFRLMRRIPAVVYRHRKSGAVIARSSQPEVGWLGWRSTQDEALITALINSCCKDREYPGNASEKKLLIVDARSYTSAVTNRARGGGYECSQYYDNTEIQFMSLPNIHNVRRSFQQIRALMIETNEYASCWLTSLERTQWLHYLASLFKASCTVARAVHGGRPVLVHCSDGWDRTSQIVASAEIILDPYYRTIKGFRVLIEREWLDFGHKFADRCGHQFAAEDQNERSPIFLQWLDLIHQMTLQFPCAFEFNEAYLIKLATHVHSCMFGSFLCNTKQERMKGRVYESTAQVWYMLNNAAYVNHFYSPQTTDQVLWPDYDLKSMRVWTSLFIGDSMEIGEDDARLISLNNLPQTSPIARTRSYDNLHEIEKKKTLRRSSDPNIGADVVTSSSSVQGPSGTVGHKQSTLSHISVDDVPAVSIGAGNQDEVDGLHPHHFQVSPVMGDVPSASSSVERELSEATDTQASGDFYEPSTSQDVIGAENLSSEDPEYDIHPDAVALAETSRVMERVRNVSIGWRSVSESSSQSLPAGFEIADDFIKTQTDVIAEDESRDSPPGDNHNSTDGDAINHNIVEDIIHDEQEASTGDAFTTDTISEIASSAEARDGLMNVSGSSGSEAECDNGDKVPSRRGTPARHASELTLCPTSPRRQPAENPTRQNMHPSQTSGIETSGESVVSSEVYQYSDEDSARVRGREQRSRSVCVCGGRAEVVRGEPDPIDGLPPSADPLQTRLHRIIYDQQRLVDGLTAELQKTKDLLKRTMLLGQMNGTAREVSVDPSPLPSASIESSASGSVVGSGSSSAGSVSGSEVEIGEEAQGVHWVPDHEVVRCQYCSNNFWLGRRRHHCRRCGRIFCSSCSSMSPWSDGTTIRMCVQCRTHR